MSATGDPKDGVEFDATRPLAGRPVSTGHMAVAPAAAEPAAFAPASAPAGADPTPLQVTRIEWNTGKPLSGRYRMIKKLGEGGMGTVYLAEDLLLRRKIALKTLWDDDLFEPADIERFCREVAVAHSVSHLNVARTYDLGEAGGVHFITMEWLKGETLMGRIKDGPRMTCKEVREIAIPLCRGLLAAHQASVVHRDLKPANVMLVPGDRKVAVMDFGIAATFNDKHDNQTLTKRSELRMSKGFDVTSAGLGTPVYMAPEQWDQATGDQRTDIYALGVILYVALTAQAPYHADTAEEIGNLHRTAPVPDVTKAADNVDPDLAALVKHCLAKRPTDRPQSMQEVLERLERPARLKQYVAQLSLGTVGAALTLALVGMALYQLVAHSLIAEVRPSMRRLATLGAQVLSEADLDQIKTAADVKSPAYRRIAAAVARVKDENPETTMFYVMRATATPSHYAYVYDEDHDANGNGKIEVDNAEDAKPPGYAFDGRPFPMMAAALATGKPQTDDSFAPDPDANFRVALSGYAPVPLGKKDARYFIGVDATSEPLNRLMLTLAVALSIALGAVVATLAVLLSPTRRFRLSVAGPAKPELSTEA